MSTEENTAPRCPACHIGCPLESWQCGRGKRMHDAWQETGTLPKPGPRGPHGPQPQGNATAQASARITTGQRVVRSITFLPRAMKHHSTLSTADAILLALAGRNGLASTNVLTMETAMLGAGLQRAIDELVEQGLASTCTRDDTTYVRLDDAGSERIGAIEAKQTEENVVFLSCLDDDELEQLANLLEKALQANTPQRH